MDTSMCSTPYASDQCLTQQHRPATRFFPQRWRSNNGHFVCTPFFKCLLKSRLCLLWPVGSHVSNFRINSPFEQVLLLLPIASTLEKEETSVLSFQYKYPLAKTAAQGMMANKVNAVRMTYPP